MRTLEDALGDDPEADGLASALVVLASVAGRDIPLDDDERHGAARRALLLLAAGGDPARGLDLNGRAVSALADDLRDVDRQRALEDGLRDLRQDSTGLPHISEAVRALLAAPDIAWRAYAASVLVQELEGDEES
jgi:hypothetical protein